MAPRSNVLRRRTVTKEERKICHRLWENMQKDSSPWVWSEEGRGFVTEIDGLTLVLCSHYDYAGHEFLRIKGGDISATFSPGFWDVDDLSKMWLFLNKREAAQRNEKKGYLMAKLSSVLA